LTGDSHWFRPFLRKTAFIDDQGSVGSAAQQAIAFARNLRKNRLVRPRRCGNEILCRLIVRTRNYLDHAFDVLLDRLHETAEVVLWLNSKWLGFWNEVLCEALVKIEKRWRKPIQWIPPIIISLSFAFFAMDSALLSLSFSRSQMQIHYNGFPP